MLVNLCNIALFYKYMTFYGNLTTLLYHGHLHNESEYTRGVADFISRFFTFFRTLLSLLSYAYINIHSMAVTIFPYLPY